MDHNAMGQRLLPSAHNPQQQLETSGINSNLGKRALSETDHVTPSKRVKSTPSLDLTPAIWQHVFTFLDPATLCRVIRLNKFFNKCLLDSNNLEQSANGPGLHTRDHEEIWTLSRTRFAPALPSPLPGIAEHTMLSLVTGRHCQQCGRPYNMRCDLSNIYHAGPGTYGVRVIWPFAVRICGQCLAETTIRDVDLLVSPVTHLRPGMTYIFRAPALHYLPPWQVETKAKPTVALFKVYHLGVLHHLRREYELVNQEGPAALSEWHTKVIQRAKALREQSEVWHNWEASINGSISLAKAVRDSCRPVSDVPATFSTQPLPRVITSPYPLPQPIGYAPGTQPAAPNRPFTMSPHGDHWPPPHQHYRPAPVQALKDAKKADIEYRAQIDIHPPILLGALENMSAFQAAVNDLQPIDDNSWLPLKAKLIIEREQTQELEYKRMTTASAIQSTLPNFNPDSQSSYKGKPVDRQKADYELSQEPIRKRLGALADRHIEEHWSGGRDVAYPNLPDFAADVLCSVRALYMQAIKDEGINSSDPEAFLNLDSMKWVYEHKIKPLAVRLTLELFNCCVCENSRFYAFEGMIQHFGAKHDEDFGENNVIVQWRRAAWTEDPPFVYHGPIVRPRAGLPVPANTTARTSAEIGNSMAAAASLPTQPVSVNTTDTTSTGISHAMAAAAPLPTQPASANATATTSAEVTQEMATAAASLLPSLLRALPQAQPIEAPSMETATSTSTANFVDASVISQTAYWYWSSLDNVRGLWNSVRLTATLNCLVKCCKKHSDKGFDLDTLAVALRLPAAKELLVARDLACQICVVSKFGSSVSFPSYAERTRDGFFASPLALVEHFQAVHHDSRAKAFGWLHEMIEVPDDEDIRGLMTAVGMNDSKLAILADAFPRVFPQPLPPIGTVTSATEEVKLAIAAQNSRKKNKGRDKKHHEQHDRYTAHEPASVEDAYDSMPEAAENEYDPRRPRFASNTVRTTDRANQGSYTGLDESFQMNPPRGLPKHDWYAQLEIPDCIRSSDLPDADEPDSDYSPNDLPYTAPDPLPTVTMAYVPTNYQPPAPMQGLPGESKLINLGGHTYYTGTGQNAFGQERTWLDAAEPADHYMGAGPPRTRHIRARRILPRASGPSSAPATAQPQAQVQAQAQAQARHVAQSPQTYTASSPPPPAPMRFYFER